MKVTISCNLHMMLKEAVNIVSIRSVHSYSLSDLSQKLPFSHDLVHRAVPAPIWLSPKFIHGIPPEVQVEWNARYFIHGLDREQGSICVLLFI